MEDISRLLGATIEYLEDNADGKSNILTLLQKADVSILDFDFELTEENEHRENAFVITE